MTAREAFERYIQIAEPPDGVRAAVDMFDEAEEQRCRIEEALALLDGPVDPPDTHPRVLMGLAAKVLRGTAVKT